MPAPTPPSPILDRHSVLAIAGLTALVLSAHLLYLGASEGCSPTLVGCAIGNAIWAQPDTTGYVRVAAQIAEEGLFGATYERRPPGYPLVLLAAQRLTGSHPPALWLAVPAAALGAVCCAWLTGALSRDRFAAIAVGVAFAIWPTVHAMSTLLLTDALHAFVMLGACVATLRWREGGGRRFAGLAALGWALAQALRPNFVPIVVLLGLLLLPEREPRRRMATLMLCASTLMVPAFLVASNQLHHGLAAPSVKFAFALACEGVPALEARLGRGDRDELHRACRERQSTMSIAERVADQNAVAWRAYRAHPFEMVAMLARSTYEQLVYRARWHHRGGFEPRYPTGAVVGRFAWKIYWLLAAAGFVVVAWRDPRLGLFLAGIFAIVMGPSSFAHTVGERYRLPVELLFLPVAASTLALGGDWITRRLRRAK